MRGSPAVYIKALNRPFTVFGVERSFFYLCVGLCVPLAVSARLTLVMDGLAVSFFLLLYAIGLALTQADVQMLALYRRHLHYRSYYAAQPYVHAARVRIKPSVPIYQGQRGLL